MSRWTRTGAVFACAAAAVGCLPARSVVFGQTAVPLRAGAAEAGVAVGPMLVLQPRPPSCTVEPCPPQSAAPGVDAFLFVPAMEANVLYGLGGGAALALHAGPLGVQPGFKYTLSHGDFDVAVLAEAALNFIALQGSSNLAQPGNEFTLLVGGKALLSNRSGWYAGLGYGFQGTWFNGNGIPMAHNVTAAVGVDIALGKLRLRPELAGMLTTAGTFFGVRAIGADLRGGPIPTPQWIVLPSLTLAVANP